MEADELIPLSLLSQYYYCPRRAALLLVEQQWADNEFTMEGSLLHERVHTEGHERRGDFLVLRGLSLRSQRLGLSGKADCIELQSAPDGIPLPGLEGTWRLWPVEYKHGERREELEYEVQICAQATCLEEMLGCRIPSGYLFYGADHRRLAVAFDAELRERVEQGAQQLHELLCRGVLPPPVRDQRCRCCSLVEICLPRLKRSARDHLDRLLRQAENDEEP